MGMAAMLLSAGTKGCRARILMPQLFLNQPKVYAQGQATIFKFGRKEFWLIRRR